MATSIADGETSQAADLALLRAYEPVVRFTKGELFLPTAVGAYVQQCSLWAAAAGLKPTLIVPHGELTLDGLCEESAVHRGSRLFLRFIEAPLSRAEYLRWRRILRERLTATGRFTTTGVFGRLLDAGVRGCGVTAADPASGINAAMVRSGHITGTVTDSVSHTAADGVCVTALDAGGNVLASAHTSAAGTYLLIGLAPGSDRVEFSSGCGTVNYLTQYYSARGSLASADPVGVTAGAATAAINAAMVQGGRITGTVTDSASHAAIFGVCVKAYDAGGNTAASAKTDISGSYALNALPTGRSGSSSPQVAAPPTTPPSTTAARRG